MLARLLGFLVLSGAVGIFLLILGLHGSGQARVVLTLCGSVVIAGGLVIIGSWAYRARK
jgi:high-affinity Fe2+/Pb2+ permease